MVGSSNRWRKERITVGDRVVGWRDGMYRPRSAVPPKLGQNACAHGNELATMRLKSGALLEFSRLARRLKYYVVFRAAKKHPFAARKLYITTATETPIFDFNQHRIQQQAWRQNGQWQNLIVVLQTFRPRRRLRGDVAVFAFFRRRVVWPWPPRRWQPQHAATEQFDTTLCKC